LGKTCLEKFIPLKSSRKNKRNIIYLSKGNNPSETIGQQWLWQKVLVFRSIHWESVALNHKTFSFSLSRSPALQSLESYNFHKTFSTCVVIAMFIQRLLRNGINLKHTRLLFLPDLFTRRIIEKTSNSVSLN